MGGPSRPAKEGGSRAIAAISSELSVGSVGGGERVVSEGRSPPFPSFFTSFQIGD